MNSIKNVNGFSNMEQIHSGSKNKINYLIKVKEEPLLELTNRIKTIIEVFKESLINKLEGILTNLYNPIIDVAELNRLLRLIIN